MRLDIAEDLCRRFESFRANSYLCPAGIPTIGYGSIRHADGRRVTLDDAPISEDEAAALMRLELQKVCAPGVMRLCPGLLSQEGRFNAIVDFVYNLGVGRLQTSTLRRKINAQDWEGAKEQLMRWTRGGGVVLRGLVKRREAECALF